MQTFGINGFGRIGRTSFRVWWQYHREKLNLKMVNTSGSMEIDDWVHLLKYDSNYGVFGTELSYKKYRTTKEVSDEQPELGAILLEGREIIVTAQRDPAKLPWGKYGVQTVIESTGVFLTQEKASLHLQGGAERVVISAPPKDASVGTYVLGVNDTLPGNNHTAALQSKEVSNSVTVLSNASCTTNCVAPVAWVMHRYFGIEKAMMTTVHAYTDDQNLHDNSHRDMRRARAAAKNIVPTTTGAAIAVTETIPDLKGMFDGLAIRVPVSNGSLSDMVFVTKRPVTVEEINAALIQESQSERWQGILAVTNEPLVSSDISGRRESSIVDLALTNVVGGNLAKVVSWYDNEYGYCNRLVEQVY